LAILDWRLTIDPLSIVDCGFQLSIVDWIVDCRVSIGLSSVDWIVDCRVLIGLSIVEC